MAGVLDGKGVPSLERLVVERALDAKSSAAESIARLMTMG